jgi:catecholate siderophore receptor
MRAAVAAACVAVMFCSASARAQEPANATLEGVALDPMQAAITGATVKVSNATTVVATARSDAEGRFSLAVPPGTHTVTVSAAGFAEIVERLTLRAGSPSARRFILPVAGVRETVTITASGGRHGIITSATRTPTPLRNVPQSITLVANELIRDQLMTQVADVVRYIPGITSHQGENNRDQVIIRGNSSSADFFVNGVRDDVQYYRDLYNVERVEALKGPNALMFGRGGGGGVVNWFVKEPLFAPAREFMVQAGQFGQKRLTVDLDHPLNGAVAFRVNGMLEDTGSFRRFVSRERAAINPTMTFLAGNNTRVTAGYEHLRDRRVADRGITSYQGRPAAVALDTYYGNPDDSHVRADVNVVTAAVEHQLRPRVLLRNRTLAANYDRFYQNYVPGAPNAGGTLVTLTAYNNATDRTNIFNQTDLSLSASTGRLRHTVLVGAEVGRQLTDNFRRSGFFDNVATAIQVPFDNTVTSTPVTYRQNATDADNHIETQVGALFVQDQVELTPHLQLLGGVRFDRFNIRVQNHRTDEDLSRPDNLISPRAGIVVKPAAEVSLYGSYSVSHLPSSGDQFSQLTVLTQQVKPERFTNYEVGAKWDIRPALAITAAAYRLDRTNTRATDPNDVSRIVQTGEQRTTGFELGIDGQVTNRWRIAGGYAYQDAKVVSATAAARAGAIVGQVPRHTLSLWNKYRLHPRLSAGLGVVQRSEMFATIDNSVVLPGYVYADAAAYVAVARQLQLQINVENITDVNYFHNADSNTNISPGSRRAVRLALTTTF